MRAVSFLDREFGQYRPRRRVVGIRVRCQRYPLEAGNCGTLGYASSEHFKFRTHSSELFDSRYCKGSAIANIVVLEMWCDRWPEAGVLAEWVVQFWGSSYRQTGTTEVEYTYTERRVECADTVERALW